jgi:hypothetical protein
LYSYRIIRRRIAWLLGQWVSRITQPLRESVYQVLLMLMDPSADLVTRFTAAEALKDCMQLRTPMSIVSWRLVMVTIALGFGICMTVVDDCDFMLEPFIPFASTALALMFQLLDIVQDGGLRQRLLQVLNVIIVGMQHSVCAHACLNRIISLHR